MFKEFFFSLVKDYGNIGMAIGLVLEFVGVPVPGETMMSLLGFMLRKASGSSLATSILFASAGTFTGSGIAYFLGFKYGEAVVLKIGRFIFLTKEKLDKGNDIFSKYKMVLLLFGRFVPGVRHVVPYLSGIGKIDRKLFFITNFIGGFIWSATFLGLGYFVGDKWHKIEKIGKVNIFIAVILIIFVILVLRLFKKHKVTIFAITFPVLIFVKMSEDVIRQEFSVFDLNIYRFLSRFISPNIKFIMEFFSFCAYTPFLICVTVIIYFIFRKSENHSKYWLIIAINLAATDIIVEFFKIAFHRDRPDFLRLVEVTGYSFPSGHSMVGMSFYGLIFYLFFINLEHFKRYLNLVLFSLFIFSIGLSRIYLGVHYASDVVGGFSAGLAWLVIYISLIKKSNLLLFKRKSE